jgi:hypothetical protein
MEHLGNTSEQVRFGFKKSGLRGEQRPCGIVAA